MTGTASVAQYEEALRSITYENLSEDPTDTLREVTWTVNDGDVDSNQRFSTIEVVSVNDAPVNLGTSPNDITGTEDVVSAIDLSPIDLSDVDDTNLTLVIEVGNGNLTANPFPDVNISGSGTNTITIEGAVSDLNAFLDDTSVITYQGSPNFSGVDTITIGAQDSGTELTPIGSAEIDLSPANDAPTAAEDNYLLDEDTSLSGSVITCLLYTSPSPRDQRGSRMPSSA